MTQLAKTPADIKIRYSTVDRFSEIRRFKTLEGARAYAGRRMGSSYDISETFNYAVSADGVGKIEAEGVSLEKLLAEDTLLNGMGSLLYS